MYSHAPIGASGSSSTPPMPGPARLGLVAPALVVGGMVGGAAAWAAGRECGP